MKFARMKTSLIGMRLLKMEWTLEILLDQRVMSLLQKQERHRCILALLLYWQNL